MSSDPRILARYRVHADPAAIASVAAFIAREQTLELPEAVAERLDLQPGSCGEVLDIELEEGADASVRPAYDVRIAYDASLAAGQLSQLLNLLHGNVSMYPGVRLLDAQLPDTLLARFHGPRFGMSGLRALLGVHGRPLLATAIKPRGLPVVSLARLARDFARGGGDVVKDDQNLVDDRLDDFRARVERIADAVAAANCETGRRCLYLPHLAGPDEELEQRAAFVRDLGLVGVLACPLLLGWDRMRALGARYGLLLMVHPALSGSFTNAPAQGIDHGFLLGTISRLAGADIGVFPSAGGRFAYAESECQGMARALREPLGHLRVSAPSPAGGLDFSRLPALAEAYGAETVLLIGGSLQAQSGGMVAATRALVDALRAGFEERVEPTAAIPSSCEAPAPPLALRELLPVVEDFRWPDRPDSAYKSDRRLAFAGVRRVELVGNAGEACAFDLRYFEIAPGGYTSLERHAHVHVLIGARGRGELQLDGASRPLAVNDVAYVAPQQVHQLRNTDNAPFGFYCIVDRRRDRPQAP